MRFAASEQWGNNLPEDATLEEVSSPEASDVEDEMLELELLAIVG